MKIRFSIVIIVIGYVLDFAGAWMKITHQAMADAVLTISMFTKSIGLILFVIFMLAHPKVKQFLNYREYDDAFRK